MAALVSPESYNSWTDPSLAQHQLSMLQNDADVQQSDFESFPISKRVNSPSYDAPDCIDPATPDDLLPMQRELLL
jgi:putative SOS response-associated peptidase YedK